jgi:glycosyltransferase involved in cell wall biosynthesis
MRIAQVSPLYESVPPKLYGGTERIVSYLTEELVAQGHDVTLFATGDSITNARLIPVYKNGLRFEEGLKDYIPYHYLMLEKVQRSLHQFDIVHYHIDYLHFPLSKRSDSTHVTTLHGRLDLPELFPLYHEYKQMPVISISDAQRLPLPQANWIGTVYHGLPKHLYKLYSSPGDYLAFIGRISPEKGLDNAIEIAVQTGIPLKVAAKIDKADKEYFEEVIKRRLEHPLVDFIGEIGEEDKNEFLGKAKALLFPVAWPEPFGLAMIEAIACGTPVIAFKNGSVPEVIDEGQSGFIVNTIEEAVEAVKNISKINRAVCRKTFETRFSVKRMTEDYLSLYLKIIESRKSKNTAPPAYELD